MSLSYILVFFLSIYLFFVYSLLQSYNNFIKMINTHRQYPNSSFMSSFANSIDQKSERNASKNHFLLNTSTFYSSMRASQTESEIFSHPIIRQIMEQRQKNTIRHSINRIDQSTALYKLPLKFDPKQFQFKVIPPENEMFGSLCSKTIKNINQGIKTQRIKHSLSVNDKKSKIEGQKAENKIINPKISVSGLTTFNFSSVKAQKSLGLGKVNYEERMYKELQSNKERLRCASARNNRILMKKPTDHQCKSKIKRQNQIMKINFLSTSQFLKKIQKVKKENGKIYNENPRKINFVKEYMKQQQVDYDDAAHAINAIEQLTKQRQLVKEKILRKPGDLDAMFQNRKLPTKRKSVQVKDFYFIQ